MVKKRSSSKGLNQSFDSISGGSESRAVAEERAIEHPKALPIVIPDDIPLQTHTCYWYLDGCNTRSKECMNMDSPGCICPVKPKEG